MTNKKLKKISSCFTAIKGDVDRVSQSGVEWSKHLTGVIARLAHLEWALIKSQTELMLGMAISQLGTG